MVNIHHKTICFITSSPSKLCYCYIIQLKFICATVFLLNTIHSTRSPKAVHLTPRSIQCYHPPPPLHHLLQQEFKINTSNCKRHSCPKAIKALQLQMVCPTTLLLLCLFTNHSNKSSKSISPTAKCTPALKAIKALQLHIVCQTILLLLCLFIKNNPQFLSQKPCQNPQLVFITTHLQLLLLLKQIVFHLSLTQHSAYLAFPHDSPITTASVEANIQILNNEILILLCLFIKE